MHKIYYISGIDTGVGKTIATGLMAKYLRSKGVNAITVKLVQTGNDGFSEDLDLHRKLMGGISFPEDSQFLTAPQIFHFPASPHLAAKLEGKTVDVEKIASSVAELAERYDVVLAEGAGGLAVPLTEDLLTVDFAAKNGWPCILVSSGKLGSLNHTILSADALAARKMTLCGVVYNWSPGEDPVISKDTAEMTRRYTKVPLVKIPRIDPENPPAVDFSAIFGD